jgi:hypothetical protein
MANKVINEGGSGFHLWTVVTDGYGYAISEDEHGHRIAVVDTRSYEDEDPTPFVQLAERTLEVMNGTRQPTDRCPERD